MGFGNIKHISSIKYKGRYKQKSIDEAIKKVNIAIDKFNESNYDISDKMLNYASKRLEELINKKIPGYYGMLLKAHKTKYFMATEIKEEFLSLLRRMMREELIISKKL